MTFRKNHKLKIITSIIFYFNINVLEEIIIDTVDIKTNR
jgi:hypothetical protein